MGSLRNILKKLYSYRIQIKQKLKANDMEKWVQMVQWLSNQLEGKQISLIMFGFLTKLIFD